MKLDKTVKIGIVGLGLMGGSYAQALTRLGFDVGAIDARPEAIEFAIDHGLIARGSSSPDPELIASFDLIVFALYPKTLLAWLTDHQSSIKPGALLTDVTGVKQCIVYDIQAMLRPDLEFIGSHPMAGREVSGVENARMEIFQGANFIVTPTEKNTPEAIETACELGRALGFGPIKLLSPEKHDEMIAFLSQLTHCIAIALMTCRDTQSLVEYSGDSFRDLTRIARINDQMWSELFLLNKEALLSQMDLFEKTFRDLREHIANGNQEEIRAIMRASTRQRELFVKKEGKRS